MVDLILKPLHGPGPNLPASLPVVLAGKPGLDGASAYQLAVAGGFQGTMAEWLASLVGQLSAEDRASVDAARQTGRDVAARLDVLTETEAEVTSAAAVASAANANATVAADTAIAAAGSASDGAAIAAQASADAASAADEANRAASEAVGALTDFSARWMGVLSVAPTTATEGALYFDTVGAQLMMWRGGAWQAVATGPAAADLLALIKTVDGAGSGLDSDTMRGIAAEHYMGRIRVFGSTPPSINWTYPIGWSCVPNTSVFDPYNVLRTDGTGQVDIVVLRAALKARYGVDMHLYAEIGVGAWGLPTGLAHVQMGYIPAYSEGAAYDLTRGPNTLSGAVNGNPGQTTIGGGYRGEGIWVNNTSGAPITMPTSANIRIAARNATTTFTLFASRF